MSTLFACTNTVNKSDRTKRTGQSNQASQPAGKALEPMQLGPLVCQNAARFAGRKIGDGHCVSLIKQCTQAPFTKYWRPGEKVLGNNLKNGTIIATFLGQRYPSRHGYHAAIYIEQDSSGIWVWDQWLGKPVHKRLIRIRHDSADPGNTAQAYRVVQLN